MNHKLISIVLLLFIATSLLAQTVYITRTGKKYHESSCSSLRKSSIPIDLKEAVSRGFGPCSRCNPPILSVASATTKEPSSAVERKTTKSTVTSGRCQATTKKGTQCKRNAKSGSNYCWQHGG